MELINRDKLDDYKFRSASERMDLSVEYMSGWNDAIYHIEANAPTVDAEPVRHGHWIRKGLRWHCSACGYGAFNSDFVFGARYCPTCGAKMDAEEKEE